jgi:ubiquinol oxidase
VACSHTTTGFSHCSGITTINNKLTTSPTSTTKTQLLASLAPNEELERSENNPSTKFGSPISDKLKDANRFTIGFLKGAVFDTVFAGEGREFARFYALETIARVPYFSYLSVLHLYETLGKWRRAKYLKLHFAESWNEMHHLLIMEELGGDDRFFDRFLAQHIAFGYYAIVIALYLLNPVEAYNLNQDVEEHAFATYDEYLKENEEMLKGLPAPQAAIDYYVDGDMYMFDEFQTNCEIRRPVIENLYDTFVAIRDDEAAHVETMKVLQTELDVTTQDECEVDIF